MPSSSPNLGLNIFSNADQFNTTQYDTNWSLLDLYRGYFVCTSTTRPGGSGGAGIGGVPGAWGAAQNGQKIVETDTGLTWRWNGSSFIRDVPVGSLGRVSTTTTLSTTSSWSPTANGTYTIALSQTVTVPSGNRLLMIVAEVPEVKNTLGLTYLLITRTVSSIVTILNSWPVWTQQQITNSNNAGTPGSLTCFDQPNTSSAVYTLCYATAPGVGGTSSLISGFSRSVSLTVIEI